MQALAASAWREWKDHGRMIAALGLVFCALSFSLGRGGHTATALAVSIVAPFACVGIPGSAVDDASSGMTRLVGTQPLPRGGYAAARIVGLALLLVVVLAPLVVAMALFEGEPLAPALGVLALVAAWTASATIAVGTKLKSLGAATGVWVLLCTLNLLTVLATWKTMDMTDWLVRARHALPAAASMEALTPGGDPWQYGALVVLALEICLVAFAAVRRLPGFVVALVGLPFVLPAGAA